MEIITNKRNVRFLVKVDSATITSHLADELDKLDYLTVQKRTFDMSTSMGEITASLNSSCDYETLEKDLFDAMGILNIPTPN